MSKEKVLSKAQTGSLDIAVVKTYQPVQFQKKLDTLFTAARPGMEDITIVFDPHLQLVILSSPTDTKMFGMTNVAWLEPKKV